MVHFFPLQFIGMQWELVRHSSVFEFEHTFFGAALTQGFPRGQSFLVLHTSVVRRHAFKGGVRLHFPSVFGIQFLGFVEQSFPVLEHSFFAPRFTHGIPGCFTLQSCLVVQLVSVPLQNLKLLVERHFGFGMPRPFPRPLGHRRS